METIGIRDAHVGACVESFSQRHVFEVNEEQSTVEAERPAECAGLETFETGEHGHRGVQVESRAQPAVPPFARVVLGENGDTADFHPPCDHLVLDHVASTLRVDYSKHYSHVDLS